MQRLENWGIVVMSLTNSSFSSSVSYEGQSTAIGQAKLANGFAIEWAIVSNVNVKF
jgi:hypothetical protein